ncbi:Uncharacterised protein [Mycobacteroides abscessus subsp. massiliense]|uniref:Uncharacterized protein n=1 Tax=Mycobacteroides abscessus subsp. massiliense TaxID=1962118 RepID=A0A1T8VLD4_9MYCO|nr:Uncharacterised protein [Mycobacteroides abscessus subsp. massiliense]
MARIDHNQVVLTFGLEFHQCASEVFCHIRWVFGSRRDRCRDHSDPRAAHDEVKVRANVFDDRQFAAVLEGCGQAVAFVPLLVGNAQVVLGEVSLLISVYQ